MAREMWKDEKILYVWFRINRENISIHAFCLMKLNGLKEEHYLNKFALKGTQMRIEVMSWGHKSFADFCFSDLENETFSWPQFHNKFRIIFDLKGFCENLKNGSIDFFKTLTLHADNVNNFNSKFH